MSRKGYFSDAEVLARCPEYQSVSFYQPKLAAHGGGKISYPQQVRYMYKNFNLGEERTSKLLEDFANRAKTTQRQVITVADLRRANLIALGITPPRIAARSGATPSGFRRSSSPPRRRPFTVIYPDTDEDAEGVLSEYGSTPTATSGGLDEGSTFNLGRRGRPPHRPTSGQIAEAFTSMGAFNNDDDDDEEY